MAAVTLAIIALCLGYNWLNAIVFMIAVIVAVVPEGSKVVFA